MNCKLCREYMGKVPVLALFLKDISNLEIREIFTAQKME